MRLFSNERIRVILFILFSARKKQKAPLKPIYNQGLRGVGFCQEVLSREIIF